jgi:mannose-6-phosphate isomerase class I
VPRSETQAQALLRGDRSLAARLAARLLRPVPGNFVARPWGGPAIRGFKDVAPASGAGDGPWGEAFEIAAYDADPEARAHPSRLALDDGSEISLPQLLSVHGAGILGAEFVARFGGCFPLLPKTLDVKELLSMQGHPAGHTEVYVVIAADAGATIRVGFNEDVDPEALHAELTDGLREQRALLESLGAGVDQWAVQRCMQPWLAERAAPAERAAAELPRGADAAPTARIETALAVLKRCYWRMLDRMNAIDVPAGRIVHNATPARIVRQTGRPASAEVHALGNPEGLEVLALEIRKPGPTFRAWDNVRFPIRDVDVRAAIAALNLGNTAPEEFIVAPRPVPGRPGLSVSVDSEHFRLEHLEPGTNETIAIPAEPPHSLHVLAGAIRVYNAGGEELAFMARGESAIVPIGVGAYSVRADGAGARAVKVNVP